MTRKVIIDCDPGIDDAVALCLALFEPRLEVVGVTAVQGSVPAEQASRNVQAIIEQLDAPRFPRVGTASPLDEAPAIAGERLHGFDGLGNAGFRVSQLHHQRPSDKIIVDEVRAAPDRVTIVCLGPLTNLALAMKREPGFVNQVDRIIITGGSVMAGGNITAAAELNMHCDPNAARTVFRSPTTKTLIPLDVTQQVAFSLDLLDLLPGETTRAGRFLRRILPFSFHAHHQELGRESIYLHGTVAVLALVHSGLFTTTEMAGDVETRGDLTTGATIFDRRAKPLWLTNMEVATKIDGAAATDAIVQGLADAGRCTR
jgi:purine nucleosidase